MKTTIEKGDIRKVRKIIKSKLNGLNQVKAENTWAVSLFKILSSFCKLEKLN